MKIVPQNTAKNCCVYISQITNVAQNTISHHQQDQITISTGILLFFLILISSLGREQYLPENDRGKRSFSRSKKVPAQSFFFAKKVPAQSIFFEKKVPAQSIFFEKKVSAQSIFFGKKVTAQSNFFEKKVSAPSKAARR